MFSTLTVQRLSVGSVYKLWFIGLGVSLVLFSTLMGLLALFGFNTLAWNGQHLHGMSALLAGPFIGAFMALLFTGLLGSASAFGLWLYSKVRGLTLEAKNLTAP